MPQHSSFQGHLDPATDRITDSSGISTGRGWHALVLAMCIRFFDRGNLAVAAPVLARCSHHVSFLSACSFHPYSGPILFSGSALDG